MSNKHRSLRVCQDSEGLHKLDLVERLVINKLNMETSAVLRTVEEGEVVTVDGTR